MATTGSTPSPVQKVQFLIHYLKLDDSMYIQEHLNSGKGKETQGKLNSVSKGEIKTIGTEYMNDDQRFKRIAIEARKDHALNEARAQSPGPTTKPARVSSISRRPLVSPSIDGTRHPDREVSIRVIDIS